MEMNITTKTHRRSDEEKKIAAKRRRKHKNIFVPFAHFCGYLSLFVFPALFSVSCSSKPTDLRTFIPGDALVYLETNDLSKTLRAVTENQAFQQSAKGKPNFSALAGIQLAVAVTGFETSEKQITDENSILNFQPRFVVVAETHAWNWQTLRFTEDKLGEFVNENYGGEVELEITPKNDGKYFVWTAQDGRKMFALVQNSLIFFGNDESAIDKCLAVKRGEAESITKNSRITANTEKNLALGYVSPDGIAQIASLVGISMAMEASDEGEIKSFIARVLPQLLRNSIREISWTAQKTEQGIEDRISIVTNPDVSTVFNETIVSSVETGANLSEYLPEDVFSATRYDLKDPQIAWRSVLLVSQKQTDELSGKLIVAFSGSLFEPYGVKDGEMFLSSVSPQILTAKFDPEGEKPVVIVSVKDLEKVKKSISGEINFNKPPEKQGNSDVWKSEDGELAAAFFEDKLIVGDAESVIRCLHAKDTGQNFTRHAFFKQLSESKAVAVTAGKDTDSAEKVIEVLADKKSENAKIDTNYFIETRFNQNGIERRAISDFGLIGSIIEQFTND